MAWIDVKKAYVSVDHKWLVEMMAVHRFPDWVCKMVSRLCATLNTRLVVTTKEGRETLDLIKFSKGLPQGDALCFQGCLRYALTLWLGNSKPQRATNCPS